MDVYCIVQQTVRLSMPTRKTQLQTPLAYNNTLAHAMRVTVLNEDGTDAVLTGVGVTASMMRADGETVTPILGTTSGNVAEVILPASCYVAPGRFKFTMNLTDNGSTRTVLWVEGFVERNTSDDIVDPGTPVGNIETAIGHAEEAAEAASTAAENASAFTSAIAPTFEEIMAASPFVPLGAYVQHCWYDGGLYVNTVDIDQAETWNSAHWEAVDISGELAWRVMNGDIADEYSPEDAYGRYAVVWHEGDLYISNQVVIAEDPFNPAHWSQKSVGRMIRDLNNGLTGWVNNVQYNIAPAFSTSQTYAAGDYAFYENVLYQFTASHSGAWLGTDATAVKISEVLKGATVAETLTYLNIPTS